MTPQIVRGLALALRQGVGKVTLRLHPENLGQVVVRVKVEHGQVTATLSASDPVARRLLASSVDDLRAALEARGMSVERVEIEPAAAESPRAHAGAGGAGTESGGGRDDGRDASERPPPDTRMDDAAPGAWAWEMPSGARITRDSRGAVLGIEAVA